MPVQVVDDRLLKLVQGDVEIERIAAGPYAPAEGPVWVADSSYLLFTDTKHSRILRWSERDGVSEVDRKVSGPCGMTLDSAHRLVICAGGSGEVVRMIQGSEGETEVLASHYDGKRLNSPNDVVVTQDGSIYFTDPWWGQYADPARERELDVIGVYRITPSGGLSALVTDFEFPNGLCLSPDESILYVNDTHVGHIRAFDIRPDGSLGPGRIFAADIKGDPSEVARHDPMASRVGSHIDGLKCDEHGNVWTTGPFGIWVFSPDGAHLGVVEIPEPTRNLHWGGQEWRTVYVGTLGGLYRFEAQVAGRLEPFMRGTS
jgi:gluconolactonase